jgi:hypothetical protein
MEIYEGVEVYLHVFFTSALDLGEWLLSRLGRFTAGKRAHGMYLIGELVGPSAGLEAVTKKITALGGNQAPVTQPVA